MSIILNVGFSPTGEEIIHTGWILKLGFMRIFDALKFLKKRPTVFNYPLMCKTFAPVKGETLLSE
jgi:hypothetical protein